jgi:hypothetical protein
MPPVKFSENAYILGILKGNEYEKSEFDKMDLLGKAEYLKDMSPGFVRMKNYNFPGGFSYHPMIGNFLVSGNALNCYLEKESQALSKANGIHKRIMSSYINSINFLFVSKRIIQDYKVKNPKKWRD